MYKLIKLLTFFLIKKLQKIKGSYFQRSKSVFAAKRNELEKKSFFSNTISFNASFNFLTLAENKMPVFRFEVIDICKRHTLTMCHSEDKRKLNKDFSISSK